MGNALTHYNGGVIEVFSCAECQELCEKVPCHISDWPQRFCSLNCARDFFHNLNTRRREHVN